MVIAGAIPEADAKHPIIARIRKARSDSFSVPGRFIRSTEKRVNFTEDSVSMTKLSFSVVRMTVGPALRLPARAARRNGWFELGNAPDENCKL